MKLIVVNYWTCMQEWCHITPAFSHVYQWVESYEKDFFYYKIIEIELFDYNIF